MKEYKASIDYLILANHVEAVNGLLYINGAGWTDHVRPANQQSNFGVGVSICIPWHETNQPHDLIIRVENEDGTTVLANVEAQLNIGRPPTLPPGTEQHAAIGMTVSTIFPSAGNYQVVAQIDKEGDFKRWAFRVHDGHIAS
jgi:hypothetical protein